MKRTHRLGWPAQIVLVSLWLGTVLAVLASWWEWPLPFNLKPDPLARLFPLISTAVTALVAHLNKRLRIGQEALEEAEQFSAPRALAISYVKNFLRPIVTHLREKSGKNAGHVRFYIFIPDRVSDMEEKDITDVISELRKQFDVADIKPKIDNRDYPFWAVTRSTPPGQTVYLDFAKPIRTLNDVLEDKATTSKDTMTKEVKRELGSKFIERFQEFVKEAIGAESLIGKNVEFIKKDLSFKNPPPNF